jgi:hypothetical protein
MEGGTQLNAVVSARTGSAGAPSGEGGSGGGGADPYAGSPYNMAAAAVAQMYAGSPFDSPAVVPATAVATAAGSVALLPEAVPPQKLADGARLKTVSQNSALHTCAKSLMETSWNKKDLYEFVCIERVQEVENAALARRYEQYCAALATLPSGHNEQYFFHGSSEAAYRGIADAGFLKSFQTSAAGEWQRMGNGFYFALHASKSHDYPPEEMRQRPEGEQTRSMLLCKVAKGNVYQTQQNMAHLTAPPDGFHSVHGQATEGGPMNFDELVVYDEAAILPWALVTYRFKKLPPSNIRIANDKRRGGGRGGGRSGGRGRRRGRGRGARGSGAALCARCGVQLANAPHIYCSRACGLAAASARSGAGGAEGKDGGDADDDADGGGVGCGGGGGSSDASSGVGAGISGAAATAPAAAAAAADAPGPAMCGHCGVKPANPPHPFCCRECGLAAGGRGCGRRGGYGKRSRRRRGSGGHGRGRGGGRGGGPMCGHCGVRSANHPHLFCSRECGRLAARGRGLGKGRRHGGTAGAPDDAAAAAAGK